ncbi:MAG: pullulanase-type alpha-1,6-glucosidase [Thermoanaerobaculia bacterium]
MRWSFVAAMFFASTAFAAIPTSVTVAGSLQSELGCPDDWQPACAATHLAYDPEDDVWQKAFNVPAGSFEYKAPLNDAWTENYGLHAQFNGANIPLNLATAASVKFYYDHKTHWITDNHNSIIAVAPGSYQSKIGCNGDWDPSCLQSWLEDPDGDGIFTFSAYIPAGSYEVKVAINESWDLNYGANGDQNGANIPFTVATDCTKTQFRYDSLSHILTIGPAPADPQPGSVTIAGSLQSEVGCAGDWDPACTNTHLGYDATDGVWQGTFNIPAGNWEYKAALNNAWDENYGANATPNGSNLTLNLAAPASVKFYYDHETHWVADNQSKVIATAVGSFQSEIGCPGDWQPDCLQSWLEDPDGDGLYTFSTRRIPAGSYEMKVTINESWDLNYGDGGVQNGANIAFSVAKSCTEMFFLYNSTTHVLSVSAGGGPNGNLNKAQAHWVSRDTIAWRIGPVQPTWNVALHYSATGALALGSNGVTGGTDIPLLYDPAGLPAAVLANYPHLAGFAAFKVPSSRAGEVPEALKSQLAVSAKNGAGALIDATSLQIPGVLDDLYTYNGPLGLSFTGNAPTLRLWAPTARSLKLHLFNDSSPASVETVLPMAPDAPGVWKISGPASWYGRYYLYEVEVFVRGTGHVEHNLVTDPYSVSLSRNSGRSQIVDLSSPALKPHRWDNLSKPSLDAPEDISLYELHVRDFSANDTSVPAVQRGTFKAFTNPFSNGMRHLALLSFAGLTHVHLLPSFDIATVNEDKSQWQSPAGDLSSFPPNSDQQQAAVMAVADRDGFNWGYDPWHYTVPEGSYSTNADGPQRITEFREMVQGLSSIGLRTVMDVVYNHTNSAGQNDKSVLDKIVPGYYHRLSLDGNIETSSCCPNTASEHNMMEKLLIDSVLTWAKQYKVDGFRFDLMGHHMKRNMTKLRAALDALTVRNDGVDGKKIYLYGEAWNFGEVADNARGQNAIQKNMAGTGIGSFNDRIRDGARGGGPFSGVQEQGFLTGLYFDPNATNQGTPAEQKAKLLLETDWIRCSMVGNLASFSFVDRNGATTRCDQLDYNGQLAGYTADPQEIINYIEAHDNETLFDALQYKLPVATSMAQRVRVQNLGMSLLAFSQGVPFFHAGVELLRSKSGDRNSYNSGDWFNKLDFRYGVNNWGVGLPPRGDNLDKWPLLSPLLGNPSLKPARRDILDGVAHMAEVLAVRRSTPLLRLRTAADINSRVQMLNGGPDPVPGLIVMLVRDPKNSIDRQHDTVAVLINATPVAKTYTVPSLAGNDMSLDPIHMLSLDPLVKTSAFSKKTGTFTIPGRTAAVFWTQNGHQGGH